MYIPGVREYYTRGNYLGKAHSMGKDVIQEKPSNAKLEVEA